MSEQDALNLALGAVALRGGCAKTEAARLAAARREALEALVADLRNAQIAECNDAQADANLSTENWSETPQAALSAEEAARLAEAAAAEALRVSDLDRTRMPN